MADAVSARKAGNKALVAGDAAGAYAAYTEGLRIAPADHLLLGNRAEALLALRRPVEALADADAAIAAAEAKGGWAKGYLRKANAEAALGRTRDALRSLRLGMRLLGASDPRQAWLDRIASVKELHFPLRIVDAPGMGRVLMAKGGFAPGAEVFSEHPVVRWSRRGLDDPASYVQRQDKAVSDPCPEPPAPPVEVFTAAGDTEAAALAKAATPLPKEKPVLPPAVAAVVPPDVAAACEANSVNFSFALVLDSFLSLGKEEQQIILDCCCPRTTISPGTVAMAGAAFDLSRIDRFQHLGQHTILKLLLINKVNAHRIQTHDAGIYDVASKMAHSCSPNVLYDGEGCRWTACKPIKDGEMVTFSYFAGHYLVHSAEVRQTVLRETHLFVCKCERCVGVDRTRGIRCDCGKGSVGADAATDTAVRFRKGTRLLDRERGAYDAKAWCCAACGGSWTDDDMAKLRSREDKIEAEVDKMERMRDTTEKGQYEQLKDLTERSLQYLSRDHWCYMRCCMLLAHYHLRLARRSRASAVELLQLCILWGRKYADGLRRTGVAEAAPMILHEWNYWMACACGSWPHLMTFRHELLQECYPCYRDVYPDEATTHEMAEMLKQTERTVEAFRNKVFLGKAYRAVSYDYDESELFQRWEDHLADRYVNALSQTPGMSIQKILTEESLPLEPVRREKLAVDDERGERLS
eukprot:TRINITY_DN914_c9_g1_i1.p1 TRINITY_DN914_c9_g1~~TRINITY_DN914_c9_g1_i1.p1  ORF type:complete len:713 (+),score=266.85 TRINITY_DN914_c9_g1_i1:59-2140(+)